MNDPFFERTVAILDGGFGTTLEDLFHRDISVPLWSAHPIKHEPQVIIDAHLAFLRAGADIILTATYQCAFSTFQREGYDRDEAVRWMRKAVELANDARRRFVDERPESGKTVKIGLSLGPFGATVSPAQEFDGCYPPPYGPKAYDTQNLSDNVNVFDNEEETARSVDALAEFHLERLRVFCEAESVWESIDYVAFETVPLTREVRAIRKAMGLLHASSKPWWISTVWPSGHYPEKTLSGEHRTVADVFNALLTPERGLADPPGIGINCTSMQDLPRILREASAAVNAERPWLVLYPNGGDTYDVVKRVWVSNAAGKGEMWARELLEVVRPYVKGWRGVVLGGCCRTGPEEIAALAQIIER